MKKTTRTILAFDDTQLEVISKLRSALSEGEIKEISNKEFFLIAMAVGYNAQNKFPSIRKSNTGVRMEYFKPEDNVLFCSLQIAETSSAESLLDIEKLYDLAECYAAGGVSILAASLETERNFQEWFAGFIFQNLVFETLDD